LREIIPNVLPTLLAYALVAAAFVVVTLSLTVLALNQVGDFFQRRFAVRDSAI
jgi:ABC-type dipeptide/oligopeptide/nickel transport system permease subunit